MAYDTQDLYNRSIDTIKKHNLYFIDDVIAYLGIAKPTFYDHFPVDSNQMNDIKDQLNKNRVADKVKMRKDWKDSTNATLQMGLYKLLSTTDERRALSMEYRDHTTDGEKINNFTVEIVNSQDES